MKTILQLTVNPFEKIAGYTALGLGILCALVSSVLAYLFNTRFDGVLDIHFSINTTYFPLLSEQFINMFSIVSIFYLTGLMMRAGNFRFIDLAGTMILARAPLVVAPLFNASGVFINIQQSLLNGAQPESVLKSVNIIFLIAVSLLLIVILVWYISLLYKAYRISTNLKSGKAIGSFIVAIILAEALSKILIYNLL